MVQSSVLRDLRSKLLAHLRVRVEVCAMISSVVRETTYLLRGLYVSRRTLVNPEGAR